MRSSQLMWDTCATFNEEFPDKSKTKIYKFISGYVKLGILEFEHLGLSISIVGYCLSQYVIQYCLQKLMLMKFPVNYIFGSMVPLTLGAFLLVFPLINDQPSQINFDILDVIAIIICSFGVFTHNII